MTNELYRLVRFSNLKKSYFFWKFTHIYININMSTLQIYY